MTGRIKYVERPDDNKPKEMPSGEFQAVMQSKWGRHDHHVCELLSYDSIVSPYFDYDHKQDTEATPAELDMHLRLCRNKLQALFKSDEGFDVGAVVVLQRHGWCMDSRNKKAFNISFRFYVKGYQLKMGKMGLLTMSGQGGFWNKKVYQEPNQRLAIPGGDHDGRMLTVVPGKDHSEALRCLAQLTSDTCIYETILCTCGYVKDIPQQHGSDCGAWFSDKASRTSYEKDIPQQHNASDCGAFTLAFAEFEGRGASLAGAFSQEHMNAYRVKLTGEILSGCISS
ncbi:hypothetical protein WJX72_012195 [[Myrmecia] bisecta]|uniref:Ubiquitin-like protease family profile domain-containing protein n=1 Tax=[Myrmecia] bisecta TaxID=41462 RepID=A0AAW1QBG4_9CHLO